MYEEKEMFTKYGYLAEGYCMIIKDFYANCVPFKTLQVTISLPSIPDYPEEVTYIVELPNGEERRFDQKELSRTKEEIEQLCEKENKEMEKERDFWVKTLFRNLTKVGDKT